MAVEEGLIVQIEHFGKKLWVRVTAICGNIVHRIGDGEFAEVGAVIHEPQPEIISVEGMQGVIC